MTYSDKLRDPRWQRKRLEIMQRDSFLCRDCSSGTRNLQIHHCRYAKEPWDVEEQFLLTLCEDCHRERQAFEDAAKLALSILFSRANMVEAELLADELAARASNFEPASKWECEDRWIKYATEIPQMRVFVEMVLGRSIEWGAS